MFKTIIISLFIIYVFTACGSTSGPSSGSMSAALTEELEEDFTLSTTVYSCVLDCSEAYPNSKCSSNQNFVLRLDGGNTNGKFLIYKRNSYEML